MTWRLAKDIYLPKFWPYGRLNDPKIESTQNPPGRKLPEDYLVRDIKPPNHNVLEIIFLYFCTT